MSARFDVLYRDFRVEHRNLWRWVVVAATMFFTIALISGAMVAVLSVVVEMIAGAAVTIFQLLRGVGR